MKTLILHIRDDAWRFARWAAAQRGYGSPEDYIIAMLTDAVLDDMHTPEEDSEKLFAEDDGGGVWPAGDLDDGNPF